MITLRNNLVSLPLIFCSFASLATTSSQEPLVQSLKLSSAQIEKIDSLRMQFENNLETISLKKLKSGALVNIIQSGKWDETAVKEQLKAFSEIQEQARYYRVKYYFEINKALTPEQRKQVENAIHEALSAEH